MTSLLIELLTEELPPKSLLELAQSFGREISKSLREQEFIENDREDPQLFATPRRLSVLISAVKAFANDRKIVRKGPTLAAGIDPDGKVSPALQGFAKSCGVSVAELTTDQQRYTYEAMVPGASIETGVSVAMQAAIAKLPIKKLMRWGSGGAQFVRPVHSIMILHGSALVPGEFFGRRSGKTTAGHRFLGKANITIPQADDYEAQLLSDGAVVADFAKRRALILAQLQSEKGELLLLEDDALLDEVTALVEYPAVYRGKFNPEFLSVPHECLTLSMKQHQRYFPLYNTTGELAAYFLMVSNIKTATPDKIIKGNERVLRARLSDAQFFFNQDKKIMLAKRVPSLDDVIYHNKLGSQLDRVLRIEKLAAHIAELIGADKKLTQRAAHLCKADLLTDMVGEFPELQGVIGAYYAEADGEPDAVCRAIKTHYLPRFAEDALPETLIANVIALADKLDTLVGMFGISLVPTGDKDPFGLRRQALGVMRILDNLPQLVPASVVVDLLALINHAQALYSVPLDPDLPAKLHVFMLERFKNYLAQTHSANDIEAVLVQMPTDVASIRPRILALQEFQKLPAAMRLAAADKRIRNILKKASADEVDIDATLFQQNEERALYNKVTELQPAVSAFFVKGDYQAALFELSTLADAVDLFFEKIMVMAENAAVRANRLALLWSLRSLMNKVADISLLAKVQE